MSAYPDTSFLCALYRSQANSDLVRGAVVIIPGPWPLVDSAAERLSELYAEAQGHRSMDILHLATAIELGAKEVLTFDGNQRKLAEAEGLVVPA